MFIVQTYTFNPGEPGEGTIEIPAVLNLEDFGIITNVSRGSVLYDPVEGSAGATSVVVGGSTILTLEQSTTYCLPEDKLQIIVLQGSGGSEPSSDVHVTNTALDPVNISGSVVVTNDSGNPVPVEVGNWPESVEVSNDEGNPLPVTGTFTIQGFAPSSTDSFNRLRVSEPYTLLDSSFRYRDNGLWSTSTTSGGTATFNSSQGLMELSVNTSATSEVIRETVRVFPYQPGKSLQNMGSFVFNSAKSNLRQRFGFMSSQNGFFLELLNDNLALVKRSYVSGSVVETKISQNGGVYGFEDTGWNVDKLNGSGPSGITLDITKAQILFMDIEWLGVGTVRLGFVINGQFIICHEFNHANLITSTYTTTSCLPFRYEIANTGITDSPSTLKQICTTSISEGGYELRGLRRAAGTAITSPYTLISAGTFYPVIAIRLKAANLDSITVLSSLSIMGSGNNERYRWELLTNPTVTGGSWVSASPDSCVEYNITGTAVSGGSALASGYASASNQGSPNIDIPKSSLLSLQLERNGLTGSPYPVALSIAGSNSSQSVFACLDWEEAIR